MRRRIAVFAGVVQAIFLLGHWFLYETWVALFVVRSVEAVAVLQAAMVIMAFSFVASTLLAFRYNNALVRAYYTLAAVWTGFFSFFLYAGCLCWVVMMPALIIGWRVNSRMLAGALFGGAAAASIYGVVNAALLRVKRIVAKLPNLPEGWRGRTAALVSDMHLGHVRGEEFLRDVVRTIMAARPDIVFIAGDMYDGTAVDAASEAQLLRGLTAPFGVYFIGGNHEGIRDRETYFRAVADAGVRVLNNELVDVDGLQVVGVHYRESVDAAKFTAVLAGVGIDRGRASVLVVHAPNHLEVAEAAGISLQLNGHTHGGQFWPYTGVVKRIYGVFAYGLQRFGGLQVYTSSGAGTWGPPVRVGTNPEVVVMRFDG